MKKKGISVIRNLVTIMLLGVMFVGCTTTQHGVVISNVPRTDIRAVYIRNAGATDWGNNISASLNNIDKTRYSQTVDVRVVDNNGVVYSKYNVPFNDDAFVETSKERYFGIGTEILIGIILLVALIITGAL